MNVESSSCANDMVPDRPSSGWCPDLIPSCMPPSGPRAPAASARSTEALEQQDDDDDEDTLTESDTAGDDDETETDHSGTEEAARAEKKEPTHEESQAALGPQQRVSVPVDTTTTGEASTPFAQQQTAEPLPADFFVPSEAEQYECHTKRRLEALKATYSRLKELAEFREQHHHCNVPQKYGPNPRLGVWVNKMRMEKKKLDAGERSVLNPILVAKLDRLGFCWGNRRGLTRWFETYQSLVEFRGLYGHVTVPTRGTAQRRFKVLGRWVSTQRAEYAKFVAGSPSLLDQERINLLNALGFEWSRKPQRHIPNSGQATQPFSSGRHPHYRPLPRRRPRDDEHHHLQKTNDDCKGDAANNERYPADHQPNFQPQGNDQKMAARHPNNEKSETGDEEVVCL